MDAIFDVPSTTFDNTSEYGENVAEEGKTLSLSLMMREHTTTLVVTPNAAHVNSQDCDYGL